MRLVVKIGTSTITYNTGKINYRRIDNLCKVVSDLRNSGVEVILVSSGAIGMGVGKLHLHKKPTDIATKQAAASVGQCELMYVYDRAFSEFNQTVSQILITAEDVEIPLRLKNFRNTINKLLSLGVIPIINENDTVSVEEFGIGDNDTLSAIVAKSVNADLLVLLSDIDGLYTADPHKTRSAKLIEKVKEIDDKIVSLAKGKGSELATGGMETKIKAAKIVTSAGTDMIITNGANIENLYKIADGESVGTIFLGKRDN
ncbi:MAG: glutamate 5-kinase [Clostridia bacterium]|nr:glutamate 5-kinase [Clostridia bacterium]